MELDEAWPLVAEPHPEPWVVHPSDDDQRVLAFDARSAGRPVVLPPVRVHDLPGAAVLTSGLVEAADGRLVVESAKRVGHLLLASARSRPADEIVPAQGIGAPVAVPARVPAFYHWVIDALPRLRALEAVGDGQPVDIVVPPDTPRFADELLERVLPAGWRVRRCPPGSALRYERTRLATFETVWGHGIHRPPTSSWLVDRLLDGIPVRSAERSRLWISRSGAAVRRIENEDEVLAALRPLGVVPVTTEHLSVAEQLELFAGAELVVGPHGAGLTGALVAHDAAIVDVLPNGRGDDSRVEVFFWGLARNRGHRYVAVHHGTTRLARSFVADVDRVRDAVELALDPAGPAVAVR